jgi:hypothetical protein
MFNAATHQSFARLVLVWFALFLGVAIASPIVNPTETQMVCTTAGGMKMVVSGEQGEESKLATNMDCPLCAVVVFPKPSCQASINKLSPLAHALHPVAAALIASRSAPPFPSRGPPSFS